MKLSFRRLFATVAIVAATLTSFAATSASAATTPTPGTYRLYSPYNQQCAGGMSNNAVSLTQCQVSFGDQVWIMEPVAAAGYYRFRNQLRGTCLAFPSGANGSEARISTCVDTFEDQWWTFLNTIPASDSLLLRNYHTTKCMFGKFSAHTKESDCVLNFQDQWWQFFAA